MALINKIEDKELELDGLITYEDGSKQWFDNKKLHRLDGPAVELANGTKFWYINGNLHREDGPAVEYTDESKYWYQNGLLHREDGPAIILSKGTKEWYVNGQRHRLDGPAIFWKSDQFWYVRDTNITKWIKENGISDNPTREEQMLIALNWC